MPLGCAVIVRKPALSSFSMFATMFKHDRYTPYRCIVKFDDDGRTAWVRLSEVRPLEVHNEKPWWRLSAIKAGAKP